MKEQEKENQILELISIVNDADALSDEQYKQEYLTKNN